MSTSLRVVEAEFTAESAHLVLDQVSIQIAEVLFDLAEVGQQLPGRAGELLVAVALGDRVGHGDPAVFEVSDLDVDLGPTAPEIGETSGRIIVGPIDHLAQQLEIVERRDSVPTKLRARRSSTHASALATAGVMS